MYDVRLGSYSIVATFAGTPSLRRLKSILRYRRLAPPPRWRAVLRPRALRPPDFVRPSTSVFSGLSFVISAKSGYVEKRRPGLVGLGLRMAMVCRLVLEGLDRLADLGLVRVRVDAEDVLVGRREHVGLLGDDGADDDLAGIHQASTASRSVSAAPR